MSFRKWGLGEEPVDRELDVEKQMGKAGWQDVGGRLLTNWQSLWACLQVGMLCTIMQRGGALGQLTELVHGVWMPTP